MYELICLTKLGCCGRVRGVRNTPPEIACTRSVEGELLEGAASGEYLLRHRVCLRLTRGLLVQIPKSLNSKFMVFLWIELLLMFHNLFKDFVSFWASVRNGLDAPKAKAASEASPSFRVFCAAALSKV